MRPVLRIALAALLACLSMARPGDTQELPTVPPPSPAEALLAPVVEKADELAAALEGDYDRYQDPEWVKGKLAGMVEIHELLAGAADKAAEAGLDEEQQKAYTGALARKIAGVSTLHTAQLRYLIRLHGWFNVQRFGAEADRNACQVVLQAHGDPGFQRSVLARLELYYRTGDTDRGCYAKLYDLVHTRGSSPRQRYGTLGTCEGGRWVPYPLEDEARLDEYRAEAGLGPFEEFRLSMQRHCQ